jgi:hypothetical protein
MDFEENEARNGCADEGQQQFNRPISRPTVQFSQPLKIAASAKQVSLHHWKFSK